MNSTTAALNALFNRIPRRHSVENVKDINSIITEYEDLLITIEAVNAFYEKNTSPFFDEVETVKSLIKKSTDNKAAKKSKDSFFNEASGALKDSIEALLKVYADGNRMA
jgi:hypothetical protein